MKLEKLSCPNCSAPLRDDIDPKQKIECEHCGTPLILTELEANQPIFCPTCQTLNGDDIRFCTGCGQQLKVGCVMCHEQNRIDTTHCAKCGVHLERAMNRRRHLRETSNLRREERLARLKEKEARQKQEHLERLIEDLDEPENHATAIVQLNRIGLEAVEVLIETLLNDDDVDARYGSARALGQIMAARELDVLDKGRQTTIEALIQALADPELSVRYWAVEALGRCKSNLAITPLANLLDAPHKGLRSAVRSSLQQIGGDRVEKILAKPTGVRGWLAKIRL